jgi:hypothetical protein
VRECDASCRFVCVSAFGFHVLCVRIGDRCGLWWFSVNSLVRVWCVFWRTVCSMLCVFDDRAGIRTVVIMKREPVVRLKTGVLLSVVSGMVVSTVEKDECSKRYVSHV